MTISSPAALPATLRGSATRLGLAFVLAVYGLYGVVAVLHTRATGAAPGGAPAFYDFSVFYQAADFARTGHAQDAYDPARMVAAQTARFPAATTRLPWSYPPTLQLLLAPLSALPYVAAWSAWSLAGVAALIAGLSRAAPRNAIAPLALAPSSAMNLLVGQTGLFAAGLVSAAFAALEAQEWMAGGLLGLLALKPQLALMAPVALAIAGRWRALVAATVTQLALAAIATLALGPAIWSAFAQTLLHPDHVFTGSSSSWRAVPSMLIFARTLGASGLIATCAQATAVALAVATLVVVVRREPAPLGRAAAFGCAAALATPYLRAYDLTLLLPAIGYVWAGSRGLARWLGRAVAALAWATPAALMLAPPQIQYGPIVVGALAICVMLSSPTGAPAAD